MSDLRLLQNASTLKDFSKILGFTPSKLAFIIFKIPENKKYSSFELPKKDGGYRTINIPDPRLKYLQKKLANLLNACIEELDEANNLKPLAHGFKSGLSIHTNAKIHKNRRYVLNFDIEDFFPSINFGRVRGYFIKNKNFSLDKKVATLIAQICCHENQLPQGSPCSPVVSNLIAHILDVRLVGLAKKYKCSYSRYADDITFSTNQKEFPSDLARPDTTNPDSWILTDTIEEQVSRVGFKINKNKTRLRYHDRRQVVTGLIVNQKVNVRREYYKLARAMTHSLFTTGKYIVPTLLSPLDIPGDDSSEIEETELARIQGVLNHIHYTRNLSDQRDLMDKQDYSTSIWSLYRDLLFYKYFGASEKPLIICEGVSDYIYLKHALKKLHNNFPNLIIKDGDKFSLNIKFLRHSKNVKELLQLSGGTGDLARFVGNYAKMAKKYKIWSPSSPVIILTDNDKGSSKKNKPSKKNAANAVFNAVRENSDNKNLSIKHDGSFYYVNNNLYLIKTPHIPGKMETCIEDLFDKELFNYEINGKKFNPENDADSDKFYGKRYFAERVIAKNFKNINFDGFEPLINRLAEAIDDFRQSSHVSIT